MNSSMTLLEELIFILSKYPELHSPKGAWYNWASRVAKNEAGQYFSGEKTEQQFEGPLGGINFPFHKMGNITSLHLFGLDELILFSYYWANKNRYKRVSDLGGNIGLHSIILNRCGYHCTTYEPDPINSDKLMENLRKNDCKNVKVVKAAVSDSYGKTKFTRVIGNLTGSHLKGAKSSPYGETQEIEVDTVSFKDILSESDFIKMDIEGHEAHVILSTTKVDWLKCDVMLEIGSPENAKLIFEHLSTQKLAMFSQKSGWQKVTRLSDVPISYHEGSFFVTSQDKMSWE